LTHSFRCSRLPLCKESGDNERDKYRSEDHVHSHGQNRKAVIGLVKADSYLNEGDDQRTGD
jgi:hypothetical protein